MSSVFTLLMVGLSQLLAPADNIIDVLKQIHLKSIANLPL
jgi:hypothetical protein